VYGVGFACAMLAAALPELWHRNATTFARRFSPRDATWVLLLAAGMLLPRIEWTTPQGAPVKVALLQGNIPQDLKFVEGRFESTLALYRRLIDAHPATLVVLPETALPRMLHAIPRDWLDALAHEARAAGRDIVVGVPLAESRERYFNSAISLGASATARYDKAHLVPFGEFIPWGFRWFVDAMNMPLGDFTRGTDMPRPLALGAQQVAVNICYEDLFGEEIIRQLPAATLLVNISNIAWFGDSLAPHQHLEISRMRAIETGRPMLRATNTGMTAVIDASGAITQRLAPFTEGALVAQVQGRGGATPYVRYGNLPVIGVCAFLLAWAAWRRRVARGRAPA
jgi:apolipoprotein N-acyltransferase